MKKTNPKDLKKKFTSLLLKWNKEQNIRQMPWKGEQDPYKIWLSEIILQQTRVEQGLNYYNNFVNVFPNIHKLARASDEKIYKLWEGLGYYTRCKNLIATARHISKQGKGIFPDTYDEIKALKGIGPYTAAAISSFAFNLPYAVVDGNVFRVLSRIFGIDIAVDSTQGKRFFTTLANELLDNKQPGLYNQAIMDFGAVVCKPAAPFCTKCVFKKNCIAFLTNKAGELPVKQKIISIKKRWFYYLVIEFKNKIALRQRINSDIWRQLYEFPMVEAEKEMNHKNILKQAEKREWLQEKNYEIVAVSPLLKQKLSHQLIVGQFIRINLHHKHKLKNTWEWSTKNKINKYPFPGVINQYLKSISESQTLF
jgi:A/G-specific adenine glycosylase